jgi:phosphoglycolate phosphatase-like HAD superfamily hydrolase
MKQSWGLLFDLDQTLVLTRALQQLRDRRQWSHIDAHLHLTRLPSEDTLTFLQHIRPLVRLGIVTSSPRRYAESVVAHHHLNIPVLAAWQDTPGKHKPDPEPLLFAARKLALPPSRCIHVGDQDNDIVAAHRAGMLSLYLSWDGSVATPGVISLYPHTVCQHWQDVLTCIQEALREE